MHNKKLNRKGKKNMKIKEIRENYISFDTGHELMVSHDQNCSEEHWADTSVLSNYNISPTTGELINMYDVEFCGTSAMIQPVNGAGFNLVAANGDKFFIPCYGENNGYYSSDLTLEFGAWDDEGHYVSEFSIDLTDCQDIRWG